MGHDAFVVYKESARKRVEQDQGGACTLVPWNLVLLHLERAIKLRPKEQIVGLCVDRYGLRCYLETGDESSPDIDDSEARWVQTESVGHSAPGG